MPLIKASSLRRGGYESVTGQSYGSAPYDAWMSGCTSQRAQYVDHDRCIDPKHLVDRMRFRLGPYWLRISLIRTLPCFDYLY